MNNDATVRAVVPIDVRNISRPTHNDQSDDDHSGSHLSLPELLQNDKRDADIPITQPY